MLKECAWWVKWILLLRLREREWTGKRSTELGLRGWKIVWECFSCLWIISRPWIQRYKAHSVHNTHTLWSTNHQTISWAVPSSVGDKRSTYNKHSSLIRKIKVVYPFNRCRVPYLAYSLTPPINLQSFTLNFFCSSYFNAMMISGPTRTVFADEDIAYIAVVSRVLSPLAAAQIWCNFIESPSFSWLCQLLYLLALTTVSRALSFANLMIFYSYHWTFNCWFNWRSFSLQKLSFRDLNKICSQSRSELAMNNVFSLLRNIWMQKEFVNINNADFNQELILSYKTLCSSDLHWWLYA